MDKPTLPIETEYMLVEVGDLIREGDEFYSEDADKWLFTNIRDAVVINTGVTKYRRKVKASYELDPALESAGDDLGGLLGQSCELTAPDCECCQ